MNQESRHVLWSDRLRRLGLPLSFTRYRLTDERLFCETGFFNIREEEILLYRIRDLELKLTLGQRIFGVGSVYVHSSDKTKPTLELKNIKNPRTVKELLSKQVEAYKDKRRMRSMEIVDDGCEHDFDHDGILDDSEE
ncbi:MAG: PH domain-containing protein [Oscillospiraceae bacterium]|nr:PH domain-containing protein [Oscillospiraceae bacterium]